MVVNNAAESPKKTRPVTRRIAVLISLVLAAIVVSGGVALALGAHLFGVPPALVISDTPTPVSTPTPASAPTPTLSPANEPPPADPTDPTSWTIDFGGIGPVRLGAPIGEQLSFLTRFTDVTDPICAGFELWLSDTSSDAPILRLIEEDGVVRTITITASPGVAPVASTTDAGIGLGATAEELQSAYPGIAQTGQYGDGSVARYYGISDDEGLWIVFSVMDGRTSEIQISSQNTIPGERCPA